MDIKDMTEKTTASLTAGMRVYMEGQLTEVIDTIPGQTKTVAGREFPAHTIITGIGSGVFLDQARWTVMPTTYVEVEKG